MFQRRRCSGGALGSHAFWYDGDVVRSREREPIQDPRVVRHGVDHHPRRAVINFYVPCRTRDIGRSSDQTQPSRCHSPLQA